MRVAPAILLSPEMHEQLKRLVNGRTTPVRLVERARVVLLAASGKQNLEIAAELGIMPRTVSRWRTRFATVGLKGIEKDLPRGGRRPAKRLEIETLILTKTTQETPRGATHWTTRSMAEAVGCTQSMVHRIWKSNNLKPHLAKTFKLSRDPHFEEKLRDVVGLYLSPPENALVISVDEKTQVQALDRTQPSLPIVPGRCGTMTHDYKRNGTTTLFAAIEMAEGRVFATCMNRHRHQEWLKFLKMIDEETPKELELHVIADNYSTHKHERVRKWLARHPRFNMHFTPTSSSWLNVIERFFRDLTNRRLKRGAFKNLPQLIDAIMEYVEVHNEDPKPFVWTAPAEMILEKVGRAKLALIKAQQAASHH